MTRLQVVDMIRAVLRDRMGRTNLAELRETVRLNEELRLDSVLILELLVHLELEFGVSLPEEAALQKQLGTVGALAELLLGNALPLARTAGGGR